MERETAAVESPPGTRAPLLLVSGLPRSGTSLMMKMLEAGGLDVVTDRIRTADEDNPRGYYELERVKRLQEGDVAWVPDARGKVVKVISSLLRHLPEGEQYKVIFMRRKVSEVLASQGAMMQRRGTTEDSAVADQEMARLYRAHLAEIQGWLSGNPAFDVLYVPYADVVSDPGRWAIEIAEFLGGGLDPSRMAAVVDPSLYRQKA